MSITPSIRLRPSLPRVLPSKRSIAVARRFIGISLLKLLLVMVRGEISAMRPIARQVLNMFEPTMLPIARSELPFIADMKLTTISGAEVPMPTIVSPIMNSLIPNLRAKFDEPSTRLLAPKSIRIRPTMRKRICNAILSLN